MLLFMLVLVPYVADWEVGLFWRNMLVWAGRICGFVFGYYLPGGR